MAKDHKVEIGRRFEGGRREILVNGKVAGQINAELDYVNGGWKQAKFVAEISLVDKYGPITHKWVEDRFADESNPVSIKDAVNSLIDMVSEHVNDRCDFSYRAFLNN